MKVALVYDRVNKWGGAERVLLALHEIWPEAPLFTSVYERKLAPWADNFNVRTSFVQRLPLPKNEHEKYPYIMGLAFEQFNFDEFDVVITITSEFCKAILTSPKTFHLCYCLNPIGYLWSGYESYFSSQKQFFKSITLPLVNYLRAYDLFISHRPDKYIAISKTVKDRIKKYYQKDCDVIYPPVNLPSRLSEPNNINQLKLEQPFFLVVSRLVPNKRIDLVIRAFNQLEIPLKVVGVGIEEQRLKNLAKSNIEFLGSLTEEKLSRYYNQCTALIIAAEEDFGITALEAQSFGKPVVAFKGGGVAETIKDRVTGFFFETQDPDALIQTIRNVQFDKIKAQSCFENAQNYSKERFLKEFKVKVEEEWAHYRQHV